MAEGQRPTGSRRLAWWLPRLLALALLVVPCTFGGLFLWKKMHYRPVAVPVVPASDPRLTFETPYRNVRPDVHYVGDAACVGCHDKEAGTYRHHPMGNSLTPVSQVLKSAEKHEFHHDLEGLPIKFFVEEHDGRMFHRLAGTDPKSTLHHEDEIRFLLGSGSRGKSALIDHDGVLMQSPISWFHDRNTWDLAPGYRKNVNFDRPIRTPCLYCHANAVLPVSGADNRYREPVFDGFAIGCERCHGPGELHVERRSRGEVVHGIDDTIVNPARLEPALREAVCQQCHLSGTVRLERPGRDTFDFRPGLPLQDFWAVFEQPRELTDNDKAVGQVEQMYSSRCFVESKGKLGCISCHDPHVMPTATEKNAYYRQRCLKCHGEQSCSLPVAKRRQTSRDDSCIQCHMPRFSSSDIAHSATTDHRVPRKPGERRSFMPKFAHTGGLLVNFFRDSDGHDPSADRDLGAALVLGARGGAIPADRAARQAALLLGRVAPDDVVGRDARAWVLWLNEEPREAVREIESALKVKPDDETLLRAAATYSANLGQDSKAVNYYQRVLKINPWDSDAHGRLAQLLAKRGQWADVETECRAALRGNPTFIEARRYLILCLLEKDQPDQAQAEMNTILSLQPANAADLRVWFNRQMKRLRRMEKG